MGESFESFTHNMNDFKHHMERKEDSNNALMHMLKDSNTMLVELINLGKENRGQVLEGISRKV